MFHRKDKKTQESPFPLSYKSPGQKLPEIVPILKQYQNKPDDSRNNIGREQNKKRFGRNDRLGNDRNIFESLFQGESGW